MQTKVLRGGYKWGTWFLLNLGILQSPYYYRGGASLLVMGKYVIR
jgi:hypothetical protein